LISGGGWHAPMRLARSMIVKRETDNAAAITSHVVPSARRRLISASCVGVQSILWGIGSDVLEYD
jgi:hypothetical protein